MISQFDPYDPCPCESGKKAKFCCLNGKLWDKKPSLLKSTQTISDISQDKCYAKLTKNCSSKISKEHFISNNILKRTELNKKVKIAGLPWQEEKTFSLVSRNSLVSKVLCTNHNGLLSPFDAEMGRFDRIISQFDKDFNANNSKNEISVFCGEDLEKWMLKTACAFIASNQICTKRVRKKYLLKDDYVDILFNDKPFPKNWGMYFKIPNDKIIHQYDSLSFLPFTANNELLAVEFQINRLIFFLLLGQPDIPDSFGIYRPRGIQLTQGNIKKTIEICWQDKKYNEGIFMERVGTTKEAPKEWDEYL